MKRHEETPRRRVRGGVCWTVACAALLFSAAAGADDTAEVASDIGLSVADSLSVDEPARLAGADGEVADAESGDQLEARRNALRLQVEDLGDLR